MQPFSTISKHPKKMKFSANIKALLLLLSVLLAAAPLASCSSSDDEPAPEALSKDTRPEWTAEVPLESSVNMSIFVEIPSTFATSEADVMAAFAGETCRAIAVRNTSHSFVLTVLGLSDETTPLTLRYFNADKSHIYTSAATIAFSPNAVIGAETPYYFTAQ